MKRTVILLLIIGVLFINGCSSPSSDLDDYSKEEAYDAGYEEGYQEGIDYILSQLRESSYSGNVYMNIEDVEEGIRIYFSDDSSVDSDEIRDAIVFHPDFDHFTVEDWVDAFISNYSED